MPSVHVSQRIRNLKCGPSHWSSGFELGHRLTGFPYRAPHHRQDLQRRILHLWPLPEDSLSCSEFSTYHLPFLQVAKYFPMHCFIQFFIISIRDQRRFNYFIFKEETVLSKNEDLPKATQRIRGEVDTVTFLLDPGSGSPFSPSTG